MSIEPSRVQVKQHTWKRHGSFRDRDIVSIADLDFYGITINCLQIPLDKILKNGFSTGHGFLRSPNSIISASALACIALQSNQNDMFGGQSIPCFEYYLAPYVAKSFAKHLISVLEVNSECDLSTEASEHIKNLCDELYTKNGTVLSKESKHEIGKYIQTLVKDVDYCIEKAIKLTDKETYQAMEAFVHNMNTLQSRCGSQTPFSSVNYGTGTTEECRMIIKNILLATDSGLGNHETPIFPIQIFKMKHGVNYNKSEPNYDLFELACKVSAKRLFPNFSFVDATYNKQYYIEGRPETEIAVMGKLNTAHVKSI